MQQNVFTRSLLALVLMVFSNHKYFLVLFLLQLS